MPFHIEDLITLNRHAEVLLASLYSVNKFLNSKNDRILFTKEIDNLCKAINDKITPDKEKFPKLSDQTRIKYGQELRQPFAVLCHFRQFQIKAFDALRDAIDDSRIFDISWNNIFVMPFIQLFTNYVRLNIYINSIEGLDRVAIVYGYCYQANQNVKKYDQAEIILDLLRTRKDYKKLTSELQLIQDRFFSIFKSNISFLSRILNSGITYTWKDLNLNDNPNPLDKKNIFLKPEYVIMQNLRLFCDCFVFFCTFCSKVLDDNLQFSDAFVTILAHSSNLQLYGDFSVEYKTVISKVMSNLKSKKGQVLDVFDDVKKKRKELIQVRRFRKRKLAMILNEYSSAAKFDSNILLSKLNVIRAALGISNFEIFSDLAMWSQDQSPDIVILLQATADLISILLKSQQQIQRFLVFNFREYDKPFLEHELMSSTIPQSEYNRLALCIQALGQIDIEEWDKGQRYDLTGLEMVLLKEMASFNAYSKARGVIHLAPLFTFISSVFYRVHLYNNPTQTFIDTCQLHHLWTFNPVFYKLSQQTDSKYFANVSCLFKIAHFYTLDTVALAEIPNFKDTIFKYLDSLKNGIISAVSEKANKLQSIDLRELVLQTKVDIAEKAAQSKDKITKQTKLSQIPVGKESILKNRKHLNDIGNSIQSINEIMHDARDIGKIKVFGKEVNVIEDIRKEILNFVSKFYSRIRFDTPFELQDQITITKIIFENIMNAAGMNYSEEFSKCFTALTAISLNKDDDGFITIKDEMGSVSSQIREIYATFFDKHIKNCIFSNTSQTFTSKDKKLQLLPSPLAIRIIYQIFGINAIAMLDILAADCFVKQADELAKHFEKTKVLNSIKPIATQPTHTEEELKKQLTKWVIPLLKKIDLSDKPPPCVGPFVSYLLHLGAIARFRRLIRSSTVFTIEDLKNMPFLSKNTRPETDVILNSRLSKSKIVEIVKDDAFAPFVGSIIASTPWSEVSYDPFKNSFSNNGHLYTCGIEAIMGYIRSTNEDYTPVPHLVQLIETGYYCLSIAQANLNVKNKKKIKFPVTELHLMFDHFIQISYYLNYSNLEGILPYQTIRYIYAAFLGKTEKQTPEK